ncbi:MAG: hypothetical protein LBO00_08850 [Zoogloeaceae bacterium]|nr:hypothetical protein [Zoogloeaceae bacterium]
MLIADDLSFSIANKAGSQVRTFAVDDIADARWEYRDKVIPRLIQNPWLLFIVAFVLYFVAFFVIVLVTAMKLNIIGMSLGVAAGPVFFIPFKAHFRLKSGENFSILITSMQAKKLNQRKPGLIHP